MGGSLLSSIESVFLCVIYFKEWFDEIAIWSVKSNISSEKSCGEIVKCCGAPPGRVAATL